jgi:nucleotidyltransferase substrate binding protein (TIGR01987 family)
MSKDIRWLQRLSNFEKAMKNLKEAILESRKRELNKLEKQGLIQAFEYNYELSWKVVKDFFEFQGETDIQGSRDSFLLAINRGLITNNINYLMDSIKSRQLTSHTYNEEVANEIYKDIINKYYDTFNELLESLNKKKGYII